MNIILQIENKEVNVLMGAGKIEAVYVDDVLADGRPGHENPESAFVEKHADEIATDATEQHDEAKRRAA